MVAQSLRKLLERFSVEKPAPPAGRGWLAAFYRKEFAPTLAEFLRLAGAFRRESEVEEIHDLRVMARRVDEYLEMLGPALPHSLVLSSQDFLHRLMRALSPVRNSDVSRGFLAETLKRDLSALERDAILRLDRALLKRREKRLGPALDMMRREDSQERLAQLVQLRNALLRAPAPLKDAVAAAMSDHLSRRVKEAFAHFDKDAALASDHDLHQLRIALRRLRYSTDACRAACKQPAKGDLQRIRRFQQVLGAHHDHAVLVNRIGKETAKLKKDAPETAALEKAFGRLAARYGRVRDRNVVAFHRLAGTPPAPIQEQVPA